MLGAAANVGSNVVVTAKDGDSLMLDNLAVGAERSSSPTSHSLLEADDARGADARRPRNRRLQPKDRFLALPARS
jgi:hypothetical protein